MNGDRQFAEAVCHAIKEGAQQISGVEIAIIPPYPYISQISGIFANTDIKVGAQNLAVHTNGAYTGEVSGQMLGDFGCEYVIIGHSERRALYNEDDAVVAEKSKRAVDAGLTPIICIGETLEQRENGTTEMVISRQLAAILSLPNANSLLLDAVVAYEPVWAIGTGKTATPEQAQQVHQQIREQISALNAGLANNMRLLYGGSVKPDNAKALFAMPDIDGGLIGGASLKAADFLAICDSF